MLKRLVLRLVLRLALLRAPVMRSLAYVWASPCSAVGLLLGLLAALFGARMQLRDGILEFGGGHFGRVVSRLPMPFAFAAITFGHVVLGIDRATLEAVRAHEQVHVRQYERWGPLLVPAYLLSSLVQLVRGRNPYLDNCFEREAYAKTSCTAVRRTEESIES